MQDQLFLRLQKKRIDQHMGESLYSKIETLRKSSGVVGAQITISSGNSLQQICLERKSKVSLLMKIRFFKQPLCLNLSRVLFAWSILKRTTSRLRLKVNDLLKEYGSSFKLKSSPDLDPNYGDQVQI